MAGRAAAPLPRSARSQPPALRAPLSLLLSPALGGGGGSSLLGSLAPVIRGAGLGGRSPRPPRGTSAGELRSSHEPRRPQPHQPKHRGGGPDRTYGPGRGFASERQGVPATHRLEACGRTQACVIRVPRARPAQAKDARFLLVQSLGARLPASF